jgi:hypothetical protein
MLNKIKSFLLSTFLVFCFGNILAMNFPDKSLEQLKEEVRSYQGFQIPPGRTLLNARLNTMKREIERREQTLLLEVMVSKMEKIEGDAGKDAAALDKIASLEDIEIFEQKIKQHMDALNGYYNNIQVAKILHRIYDFDSRAQGSLDRTKKIFEDRKYLRNFASAAVAISQAFSMAEGRIEPREIESVRVDTTLTNFSKAAFSRLKEYAYPMKDCKYNRERGGWENMREIPTVLGDGSSLIDLMKSFINLQENRLSSLNRGEEETSFVQKINIPIGSKICFMGDIHGSLHSLLRNIWRLVVLDYIDDNFKLRDENSYMVFLGDYGDRGRWSAEVWYALLRLKLANPDNVFLIKGNHEQKAIALQYGLVFEFEAKFRKERVGNICNSLFKCFHCLPSALFITVGESSFMCCHGGIGSIPEMKPAGLSLKNSFNAKFFLESENVVAGIPCSSFSVLGNQEWLEKEFGERSWMASASSRVTRLIPESIAFAENFLWGGFDNLANKYNYVRGRAGVNFNAEALKEYLSQNNLKAVFRGHDHSFCGLKVLMEGDPRNQDKKAWNTKMLFPVYTYSGLDLSTKDLSGKEEWSRIIDLQQVFSWDSPPQVSEQGTQKYMPCFTFSTAAEGAAQPITSGGCLADEWCPFPSDCFALLTTKESFKDWSLIPYEAQLGFRGGDTEDNKKYYASIANPIFENVRHRGQLAPWQQAALKARGILRGTYVSLDLYRGPLPNDILDIKWKAQSSSDNPISDELSMRARSHDSGAAAAAAAPAVAAPPPVPPTAAEALK